MSSPGPGLMDKRLLSRHCFVDSATGWLPKLNHLGYEVDPVEIGVHPAEEIDATTADGHELARNMPEYIPRDIDPQLDAAIAVGGLVLVLGDSTAGKSRAAYEAMRRLPGDKWLLIPRERESLRELLDNGLDLANAVVWLDDLNDFLGPDGLDVQLLHKLVGPGRQRVVVLATMRAREYLRRGVDRKHDNDGQPDLMQAERDLLKQGRRLEVGRRFSQPEIDRAAERSWDRRIADALAYSGEYGMAEYMAAGPPLWDRWRLAGGLDNDDDVRVGASIVAVALDCRRAGLTRPVPRGLLQTLYASYLERARASQLSTEMFEAGLSWACEQVQATNALLTAVGGGYETFDYLLDRLQADPDAPAVKDLVWTALLNDLQPYDAWGVGMAAYWADRLAFSQQAFRTGLRSPDHSIIERCALGMADLANLIDDFYESDEWRSRAEHVEDLPQDADLRSEVGKHLESAVEEWYLRVAGLGGDPAQARRPLIIEHEHVENHYDGTSYHQMTTRRLLNRSADAIDRYPFRIAVDRYPGEPEKSKAQYQKYPLTVANSAISAWHESASHGREPMRWEVQQDLPSFKEIWLLFRNDDREFPLLPGQSCTIGYEYTASDKHWGPWSKRKVRMPTGKLSLVFSYPTALAPEVTGVETSLSAKPTPMTVGQRQEGDRTFFTWEVDNPPLNAQYRFTWTFAHDPENRLEAASADSG